MSADIEIPQGGVEYVKLTFAADQPLNTVVKVSFMPEGTAPSTADWLTAEWENATIANTRTARILVKAPQATGDGHPLAEGSYNIWSMLDGTPEKVVRNTYTSLHIALND